MSAGLGILLEDMPWWGFALTSIVLVAIALGPLNIVYGKLLVKAEPGEADEA